MRLLVLVLGALLALALAGFAFGPWAHLSWRFEFGAWVALILGVVFSIALGAGLMALSFFSERRGYDDRAHEPGRPEPGAALDGEDR